MYAYCSNSSQNVIFGIVNILISKNINFMFVIPGVLFYTDTICYSMYSGAQ